MKRNTLEHPKVKMLASALGVERWGAIGVLESIWCWAGRYAPQGDVGRYPDEVIAEAVGWRGNARELVRALVETRWLDECKTHRLIIHDWRDHLDEATKKALLRAGKEALARPDKVRTASRRRRDKNQPASSLASSPALPCPAGMRTADTVRDPDAKRPPTAETWDAYSSAYAERYGEPPVRNARVNGQLADFVKRIPAVEAPHVAAFFVRHPKAYYVERGHSVACLLADAEKLRTEWATNRTTTATDARRNERTASNPFARLIGEGK